MHTISLLEKVLLNLFTHSLHFFFLHCLIVRDFYIFWTLNPYQVHNLQVFFLFMGYLLHFLIMYSDILSTFLKTLLKIHFFVSIAHAYAIIHN